MLLLTSGWCPLASRVLSDMQEAFAALPGVDEADVDLLRLHGLDVDQTRQKLGRAPVGAR